MSNSSDRIDGIREALDAQEDYAIDLSATFMHVTDASFDPLSYEIKDFPYDGSATDIAQKVIEEENKNEADAQYAILNCLLKRMQAALDVIEAETALNRYVPAPEGLETTLLRDHEGFLAMFEKAGSAYEQWEKTIVQYGEDPAFVKKTKDSLAKIYGDVTDRYAAMDAGKIAQVYERASRKDLIKHIFEARMNYAEGCTEQVYTYLGLTDLYLKQAILLMKARDEAILDDIPSVKMVIDERLALVKKEIPNFKHRGEVVRDFLVAVSKMEEKINPILPFVIGHKYTAAPLNFNLES